MGVSTSTPVAFNYDQQLLADTKVQSVEADVPEVKGETKPRRHPAVKDKLVVEAYVDEKTGEGCKTVWECFQRGVKLNAAGPFLGTRVYEVDEKNAVIFDKDKTPRRGDYTWITYEQADREVRDFGAGLTVLGARAGDNIGIFANNRAEWVQGALAFYSQNMRTVSLYATLGEDAVEYIINHAEIKICLVSQENMSNLLKSLGKIHLTHIIQFDPDARYKNFNETISEEHRKKAAEHNVQILGFTEVQKLAEGKGIFPNPPKAEDLAMVMYTSGTTGNPKGALLTHRNIVAAVAASPYIVQMNKDDRHISYLPLAHIFETVIQVSAYAMGAQIGFFQNNVKKLTADFQALKPTLLCGVPRVFSRIYQTVFAGVSAKNCVVKWYFNKAYQYQCDQLRVGRPRDAKYDAKVFIPLRERVGLDKCRIIITGIAGVSVFIF